MICNKCKKSTPDSFKTCMQCGADLDGQIVQEAITTDDKKGIGGVLPMIILAGILGLVVVAILVF